MRVQSITMYHPGSDKHKGVFKDSSSEWALMDAVDGWIHKNQISSKTGQNRSVQRNIKPKLRILNELIL